MRAIFSQIGKGTTFQLLYTNAFLRAKAPTAFSAS